MGLHEPYLLLQVLFVSDTRQSGVPAVTFTQGHGLDGPWGMVASRIVCFLENSI